MFLVSFDREKHIRAISDHFGHHKTICGRAEAPPIGLNKAKVEISIYFKVGDWFLKHLKKAF